MPEYDGEIKINVEIDSDQFKNNVSEIKNEFSNLTNSAKSQMKILAALRKEYTDFVKGIDKTPEQLKIEKSLNNANNELDKLLIKYKDVEYNLKQIEFLRKSGQLDILPNKEDLLNKEKYFYKIKDQVNSTKEYISNLENKLKDIKLHPEATQSVAQLEKRIYDLSEGVINSSNKLKGYNLWLDNISRSADILSSKLTPIKNVFSSLGTSIKNVFSSISSLFGNIINKLTAFTSRIISLTTKILVIRTISSSIRTLKDYLSDVLKTNDFFVSSLNAIKSNLMSTFYPIYQFILPALNSLMSALTTASGYLSYFVSKLFGMDLQQSQSGAKYLYDRTKALNDNTKSTNKNISSVDKQGKAFNQLNKSIKKSSKELASFDKLNVLSSKNQDKVTKDKKTSVKDGFQFVPSKIFDKNNNQFLKSIDGFIEKVRGKLTPTIYAFEKLGNTISTQIGTFLVNALKDFNKEFIDPFSDYIFTRALPRFANITDNLINNINFDRLNEALKKLWASLEPFGEHIGDGLLWFYENVISPFIEWAANNLIPSQLNFLSEAIKSLDNILGDAGDDFKWFYEKFLQPASTFTGDKLISFIDTLTGKLKEYNEEQEKTTSIDLVNKIDKYTNKGYPGLGLIGAGVGAGVAGISLAAAKLGPLLAGISSGAASINPVTLAILGLSSSVGILTTNFLEFGKKLDEGNEEFNDFLKTIGLSMDEYDKLTDIQKNKIIDLWLEFSKLVYDSDEEAKKGLINIADREVLLTKKIEDLQAKSVEIRKETNNSLLNTDLIFSDGLIKIWREYYNKRYDLIEKQRDLDRADIQIFTTNWENVRRKIAQGWAQYLKDIGGAWEFFIKQLSNGWDFIKDIGRTAGEMFGSGFKSVINIILDVIEKRLNKGISVINSAIRAVKRLPGTDWISEINDINIPRLAHGAVLRGGDPLLAYLNDQPRGHINIETPLNTMIDAFNTALQNNRSINNNNITIEANGDINKIISFLDLKIKQNNSRVGNNMIIGDSWI